MEFIEDKYFSESNDHLSATHSILVDDTRDSAREKFNKKINRTRILMDIKFAQAAQFQGNYKLALNKLEQTQSILKSQSQHIIDLKITWNHCYLRTHLARAKFTNDTNESLQIFFNAAALKQIVKYDRNDEFILRKDLFQNQQILHADFTKFLIDSFITCENGDSDFFNRIKNDTKKRTQLNDYIGDFSTFDQVVVKLLNHGIDSLSKIDGSLELALYCDYFLRQVENEENSKQDTFALNQIELIKSEYPTMVVKQLLNAIRLNSYEARQRFPRLLQIVELYSSQTLLDTFIKSVSFTTIL